MSVWLEFLVAIAGPKSETNGLLSSLHDETIFCWPHRSFPCRKRVRAKREEDRLRTVFLGGYSRAGRQHGHERHRRAANAAPADSTPIKHEVYNTIYKVPSQTASLKAGKGLASDLAKSRRSASIRIASEIQTQRARLLTVENQDHLYASTLHLFACSERAAKIGEIKRLVLVANPMTVG